MPAIQSPCNLCIEVVPAVADILDSCRLLLQENAFQVGWLSKRFLTGWEDKTSQVEGWGRAFLMVYQVGLYLEKYKSNIYICNFHLLIHEEKTKEVSADGGCICDTKSS